MRWAKVMIEKDGVVCGTVRISKQGVFRESRSCYSVVIIFIVNVWRK